MLKSLSITIDNINISMNGFLLRLYPIYSKNYFLTKISNICFTNALVIFTFQTLFLYACTYAQTMLNFLLLLKN